MQSSVDRCPPADELTALARGLLDEARAAPLRDHIETCSDCLVALAAVAGDGFATHDPDSPASYRLGTVLRDPQARIGTTFGNRYRIDSMLGRGGSAVVYGAFDTRLDRPVALKVLHPRSLETSAYAFERLLRESKAMARLQHRNVVSIYDAGSSGGEIFVAMERIDGSDLRRWLQNGSRPGWREVLDRFVQAGEGLAAAHAVGITHRDFKPDNVLVDRSGRVAVTDFGLARLAGGPRSESVARDGDEDVPTDVTMSGSLIGTPAYMAPEQFAGRDADARSDIFGFCVALFEGLYGVRPFHGNTLEALRLDIERGAATIPDRSPVPRWLGRTVLQGLEPDPARRPQTMPELLARLRRTRPSRLRSGVMALAVGLLGTTSVWALEERSETRCDDDGLGWSDDDRESLTGELRTRGWSDEAGGRIADRLTGYATHWDAAWASVCEDDDATAAARELALACLNGRREVFSTVVEHAAAMNDLSRAVAELPAIDLCTHPNRAKLRPVPPDAATDAEALWNELERLSALRAAGRSAELLPELELSVERAEQLGFGPLVSESLRQLGIARQVEGRSEEARELLVAAAARATAAGWDLGMARAWLELLWVDDELGELRRGDEYVSLVEAAIERLGDDDLVAELELELAIARAELAWRRGAYDEAEAIYRRSIALPDLRTDILDRLETGLANVYSARGDARALEVLERVHERREREYGPNSLAALLALHNLGTELLNAGRFDRAAPMFADAATRLGALNGEHIFVARARLGEALSLIPLERFDTALERVHEAIAIIETDGQRSTRTFVVAKNAETKALTGLKRYDEALAAQREALTLHEFLGGRPDALDSERLSIAELLATAGRYGEADALARQVAATSEALGEPGLVNHCAAWMLVGQIADAQKRYDDAIAAYGKSLAIASTSEQYRVMQLESLIALAKTHLARGDRAAGRDFAERARATYATAQQPLPVFDRFFAWAREQRLLE